MSESEKFPHLFSPARIGGLEVPNRVVMAPMATSFANAHGEVTEWMTNYYAERAKGGVGLIIIENANVDFPDGVSGTTQLRVDKDRYIPALSRLAQAIHSEGALCALQINHAGAVAHKAHQEGGRPVAPAEGPAGFYRLPPKVMSEPEIKEIVDRFAEAARRAEKAGFDAVEIHGAHAYLIAQFLSPLTNTRPDAYGGNTENRTRFAREVLAEVRQAVGPDFPVIFRLDVNEFQEGGLGPDEAASIAQILDGVGVDAFDLTVGTHYRLNRSLCAQLEPMAYAPGWRLPWVTPVKKRLQVPVMAVGPFREPALAEQALAEGQVDFAILGRGLIADPEWALKSRQGRERQIRLCISCNEGCVRPRLFDDRPITCTVNPLVGWEGRDLLGPVKNPGRLLVVGGGPAGCAAAIQARQRGHEVTLLEQGAELGGNCLLGSRLPHKARLAWVVDYHREKLDSLGVDVRLGSTLSQALLAQINPDFLVLAIGAEPLVPSAIDLEDHKPLHAEEVIRQGISWSQAHLAVIGGGALGCELALALAERKNKVTILEGEERAVRGIEPISRFDLLERVKQESLVSLLTKRRITRVEGPEIHYEDPDGDRQTLRADGIIWAAGYRPRELEGVTLDSFPPKNIKRIGDCRRPRNVFQAIQDGFWLGAKIIF